MATARQRAIRANQGTAVQQILQPVQGYRDELRRKGVQPKNHHKDNIEKIRLAEQMVKSRMQQRQEEEDAAKDIFKLDRFKNVQPLVFQQQQQQKDPSEIHPFLKRSSSSSSSIERKGREAPSRLAVARRTKTKPPVPSAKNLAQIPAREPKNFINENAAAVLRASSSFSSLRGEETPTGQDAKSINPDYGRVPDYLLERKLELAQKAQAKREAEENAHIPPGMVLMSEADRQSTLAALQRSLEQLTAEYARLPLTVHTQRQIAYQKDLEARISEVEDALKIFARPKVYVTA